MHIVKEKRALKELSGACMTVVVLVVVLVVANLKEKLRKWISPTF